MRFSEWCIQGTDEAGSVLDFMSMKSYPDMSLDMLNTLSESYITHRNLTTVKDVVFGSLMFKLTIGVFFRSVGKCVKKEPDHEDGHQHFDDTAKLLQEFQDAAVDRVGSRPSSNLSSLSNASERDQHHLGTESCLLFYHITGIKSC